MDGGAWWGHGIAELDTTERLHFTSLHGNYWASLVGQLVKNPPAV